MVGISIDPKNPKQYIKAHISDRITEALARKAGDPFSPVTRDESGSERRRYMIEGTIMSDLFDRHGNRVGFGIEFVDEEDIPDLIEQVHELLVDTLEIIHEHEEVEAWEWDPSVTPTQSPTIAV